jgi:TIR domain
MRMELVFVSYSGNDRDAATPLIAALKDRFQQVFDYKDPARSIPRGSPWIEEVFNWLSASALAIPLLSARYFQSRNCLYEAQQMAALQDAGKIRVVPIKLRSEEFTLPAWLESAPYLRLWECTGPDEAVDRIVLRFEKPGDDSGAQSRTVAPEINS